MPTKPSFSLTAPTSSSSHHTFIADNLPGTSLTHFNQILSTPTIKRFTMGQQSSRIPHPQLSNNLPSASSPPSHFPPLLFTLPRISTDIPVFMHINEPQHIEQIQGELQAFVTERFGSFGDLHPVVNYVIKAVTDDELDIITQNPTQYHCFLEPQSVPITHPPNPQLYYPSLDTNFRSSWLPSHCSKPQRDLQTNYVAISPTSYNTAYDSHPPTEYQIFTTSDPLNTMPFQQYRYTVDPDDLAKNNPHLNNPPNDIYDFYELTSTIIPKGRAPESRVADLIDDPDIALKIDPFSKNSPEDHFLKFNHNKHPTPFSHFNTYSDCIASVCFRFFSNLAHRPKQDIIPFNPLPSLQVLAGLPPPKTTPFTQSHSLTTSNPFIQFFLDRTRLQSLYQAPGMIVLLDAKSPHSLSYFEHFIAFLHQLDPLGANPINPPCLLVLLVNVFPLDQCVVNLSYMTDAIHRLAGTIPVSCRVELYPSFITVTDDGQARSEENYGNFTGSRPAHAYFFSQAQVRSNPIQAARTARLRSIIDEWILFEVFSLKHHIDLFKRLQRTTNTFTPLLATHPHLQSYTTLIKTQQISFEWIYVSSKHAYEVVKTTVSTSSTPSLILPPSLQAYPSDILTDFDDTHPIYKKTVPMLYPPIPTFRNFHLKTFSSFQSLVVHAQSAMTKTLVNSPLCFSSLYTGPDGMGKILQSISLRVVGLDSHLPSVFPLFKVLVAMGFNTAVFSGTLFTANIGDFENLDEMAFIHKKINSILKKHDISDFFQKSPNFTDTNTPTLLISTLSAATIPQLVFSHPQALSQISLHNQLLYHYDDDDCSDVVSDYLEAGEEILFNTQTRYFKPLICQYLLPNLKKRLSSRVSANTPVDFSKISQSDMFTLLRRKPLSYDPLFQFYQRSPQYHHYIPTHVTFPVSSLAEVIVHAYSAFNGGSPPGLPPGPQFHPKPPSFTIRETLKSPALAMLLQVLYRYTPRFQKLSVEKQHSRICAALGYCVFDRKWKTESVPSPESDEEPHSCSNVEELHCNIDKHVADIGINVDDANFSSDDFDIEDSDSNFDEDCENENNTANIFADIINPENGQSFQYHNIYSTYSISFADKYFPDIALPYHQAAYVEMFDIEHVFFSKLLQDEYNGVIKSCYKIFSTLIDAFFASKWFKSQFLSSALHQRRDAYMKTCPPNISHNLTLFSFLTSADIGTLFNELPSTLEQVVSRFFASTHTFTNPSKSFITALSFSLLLLNEETVCNLILQDYPFSFSTTTLNTHSTIITTRDQLEFLHLFLNYAYYSHKFNISPQQFSTFHFFIPSLQQPLFLPHIEPNNKTINNKNSKINFCLIEPTKAYPLPQLVHFVHLALPSDARCFWKVINSKPSNTPTPQFDHLCHAWDITLFYLNNVEFLSILYRKLFNIQRICAIYQLDWIQLAKYLYSASTESVNAKKKSVQF